MDAEHDDHQSHVSGDATAPYEDYMIYMRANRADLAARFMDDMAAQFKSPRVVMAMFRKHLLRHDINLHRARQYVDGIRSCNAASITPDLEATRGLHALQGMRFIEACVHFFYQMEFPLSVIKIRDQDERQTAMAEKREELDRMFTGLAVVVGNYPFYIQVNKKLYGERFPHQVTLQSYFELLVESPNPMALIVAGTFVYRQASKDADNAPGVMSTTSLIDKLVYYMDNFWFPFYRSCALETDSHFFGYAVLPNPPGQEISRYRRQARTYAYLCRAIATVLIVRKTRADTGLAFAQSLLERTVLYGNGAGVHEALVQEQTVIEGSPAEVCVPDMDAVSEFFAKTKMTDSGRLHVGVVLYLRRLVERVHAKKPEAIVKMHLAALGQAISDGVSRNSSSERIAVFRKKCKRYGYANGVFFNPDAAPEA